MDIKVLTLFPEMINTFKNESIIARGIEKGLFSIEALNIRAYSKDKHRRVDDEPYGGGAGMVMKCVPIYDAYRDILNSFDKKPKVIYMSPKGKILNQELVNKYSKEENIVILCGHYEGVDQRIIDTIVDDEISIGDYVLTCGELPAMVFIDSIVRQIPKVINSESLKEESLSNGLLEYQQYTRPEEFNSIKVPEVLLSGHHKNIDKWRFEQSIIKTYLSRPDLFEKYIENNKEDKSKIKHINEIIKNYEESIMKEGGK